jgi:hypothetical protein
VAVGRVDGLALTVAVTLHQDGVDAIGSMHPLDFSGDEYRQASSQLMRSYLLLPLFWVLRSPLGSQSTRLRGYLIRLGNRRVFYRPVKKAPAKISMSDSIDLPSRSIFHCRTSSFLYFHPYRMGRTRTILPSLTSTMPSAPPPKKPPRPEGSQNGLSLVFISAMCGLPPFTRK